MRVRPLTKRLLPDLRDVLALIGLASLGRGLHMIHPPLMFIGVGVVLLGAAVYPSVLAAKGRK